MNRAARAAVGVYHTYARASPDRLLYGVFYHSCRSQSACSRHFFSSL